MRNNKKIKFFPIFIFIISLYFMYISGPKGLEFIVFMVCVSGGLFGYLLFKLSFNQKDENKTNKTNKTNKKI